MAWQIDTKHSQIEFAVRHMMLSTVRGRFKQFSGDITIDEQHPENSSLTATIDVASIDTGDEGRDAHVRNADFFDVAQYPTATYTSTRIEKSGDDTYTVYGDLTLRGVTREVPLELTLEGVTKDMQGQRRAGFTARTSFNRKDFGLTWNVGLETGGVLVSDKVTITIEAQVVEPATVTA